ncbi:MAG: hypothetical protein C3F02_00470 [Parcubacteria group bacterium]|nr:MAG: hypothetical protein C3F02_00470 [Parcubacteria group bacterium]
MPKNNKKIYLLLAGGTVLIDKQGHFYSVQKKEDIALWLAQMPELNILADMETVLLAGEDDVLQFSHWENMARIIKVKAGQADGFVIVAPVEQLAQTGAILGFLLQNFSKTIILTGASISGTDYNQKKALIKELRDKHSGSGLKSNLINAIQVASQTLPGPAIMFGTRLIPAVKAIPANSNDRANMFVSQDNNYWGRVDFGISIKSGLQTSKPRENIYDKISAKILTLQDVRGVDWNLDKNDLLKYEAIIVKLAGNYQLEKEKQLLLEKSGRSVILYHRELSVGSGSLVCLADCTWETAVAKTLWAVANRKKLPAFEKVMKQNIAGEFNNT